MTVKNAAYWLARFTTGCAMWFLTFMLVLGTMLPIAILIAHTLKGEMQ